MIILHQINTLKFSAKVQAPDRSHVVKYMKKALFFKQNEA